VAHAGLSPVGVGSVRHGTGLGLCAPLTTTFHMHLPPPEQTTGIAVAAAAAAAVRAILTPMRENAPPLHIDPW
jgi:hypothetical protein